MLYTNVYLYIFLNNLNAFIAYSEGTTCDEFFATGPETSGGNSVCAFKLSTEISSRLRYCRLSSITIISLYDTCCSDRWNSGLWNRSDAWNRKALTVLEALSTSLVSVSSIIIAFRNARRDRNTSNSDVTLYNSSKTWFHSWSVL